MEENRFRGKAGEEGGVGIGGRSVSTKGRVCNGGKVMTDWGVTATAHARGA